MEIPFWLVNRVLPLDIFSNLRPSTQWYSVDPLAVFTMVGVSPFARIANSRIKAMNMIQIDDHVWLPRRRQVSIS